MAMVMTAPDAHSAAAQQHLAPHSGCMTGECGDGNGMHVCQNTTLMMSMSEAPLCCWARRCASSCCTRS